MSKATKPTTLAQALAQAQASVSRVLKEDANSFHRYQYASAEALMQAWTEASAPVGLSLIRLSQSRNKDDDGQRWLISEWVLMHQSGEKISLVDEWPIVPERGRPLDKAIASAKTSSLGYLLRDLMVAPRVLPGDDMDDSARDAANQVASEKAQAKQKAKPAKATRQKRQQVCSFCKEPGHTVKTCKKANADHKWDEKAFEAECQEAGLELAEVVEFLNYKKKPHPSQMQQADRAKVVPWLTKPEGSKMLANYFINKANEAKEQEQ